MDVNQTLSLSSLLTVSLVVPASIIMFALAKLYKARSFFKELQARGVPTPSGYSYVFGHLLFLKSILDTMPQGIHRMLMFGEIMERFFPSTGFYYLDMWPISEPFILVTSPTFATQATQTNGSLSAERPTILQQWFRPLAGGPNLFDLPEKDWKPWRTVFNKGFNTEHLLSLVPALVEEGLTYCDTLRKYARKGDLLQLDPVSLRFAMDMVGRTLLNTSLGAQKGYNTLADCMLSQIKWHMANQETHLLQYLNVTRYVMQWWNGRQMDLYIGKELDKRYQEYLEDPHGTRSKAVIDLVLQAYMTDSSKNKERSKRMDPGFRLFATQQIRTFIFAGHDSTSSTICYCIHLLSTNPEALSLVRAEHDSVFGTDLSTLPSLLSKQPTLLNSLAYTIAVIKETLRLFPAASSVRAGATGATLVDEDGCHYPTDNTLILILHAPMQRSPAYWKRPREFLPERWLVGPDHELYPMKGAWRPFEFGPRNCIGQNLVMIVLRTVLVMLVREFDFKPAYDEWDRLHPKEGLHTYCGDRAFQVEKGAAHPADDYPCRVSFRKAWLP